MDLSYSSGIADDVADALGLEIVRHFGQDDHVVGCLSDGRILKLTKQIQEVGACLALKSAWDEGNWHNSLPEISGVYVVENYFGDKAYAIVREDMKDFFPIGREYEWEGLLMEFEARLNNKSKIEPLIRRARTLGLEECFRQAIEAVRFAQDTCGIQVRDFCPKNFGLLKNGTLAVRDWGETVEFPLWAQHAIENEEIDHLIVRSHSMAF